MPLINRKPKINPTWALQAAEAGSLAAYGITLERIAKHLGITFQHAGVLIKLYFGYKDHPELLKIPNIKDAQDALKRLQNKLGPLSPAYD